MPIQHLLYILYTLSSFYAMILTFKGHGGMTVGMPAEGTKYGAWERAVWNAIQNSEAMESPGAKSLPST